MFPLVAISKRQTCASVSTPEAELVAGSHGLVRELIPALDMCDKVLPAEYEALVHEDKQAMIRVIETGRTPTRSGTPMPNTASAPLGPCALALEARGRPLSGPR